MIIDAYAQWPIDHKQNTDELIFFLDKFQIDHVCLASGDISSKTEETIEQNDMLVSFCNKRPNRLSALATVQITKKREAIKEAERCLVQLGVKGLKFKPLLNGETLFSSDMYCICELAAACHAPLIFYDNMSPFLLPSQIGTLAQMFPDTIFILGHNMILNFWQEAILVLNRFPNICITVCGHHCWATRILENINCSQILFGSDLRGPSSENTTFPTKNMITSICPEPDCVEKIMSANSAKFFRIPCHNINTV